MRKLFDFRCPQGHTFERLARDNTVQTRCPMCNELAPTIISPVRFNLDGTDPAFPTTWDRWARVHEEAARQANKKDAG